MKTFKIIKILGYPSIIIANFSQNITLDDYPISLLYDVTKGLNYTEFHETYPSNGRNPVIFPETMFSIIVYNYVKVFIEVMI